MSQRDIVAIGTSAGGVDALVELVSGLEADLPAAVLVTIHLSSRVRSSLDELLTRAGRLPTKFARDGDRIQPGEILVAPANRHLIVDGDVVQLGNGPRENNSRPAIDPMMRSLAVCCGGRAIGVVMTGTLGDGASGLQAIGRCGGLTVVQDPRDAAFAQMPQAALERIVPDHVVGLGDMAALLGGLVREPAGPSQPAPHGMRFEVEVARSGVSGMDELDRIGRRSRLTCPDCGGVMWAIQEGDLTRFRCHVGHAYTEDMMGLALDETLRRALARARRALEERVALGERLQRRAAESGHRLLAEHWAEKLTEFEAELAVVREGIDRLEQVEPPREARRG